MDKVEQVKKLVKPEYDKLKCWIHSWPHIEKVVNNIKKLAELEKVNPEPCMIAAYCHDLGRIEEEKREEKGEKPLPHALFSIEPTIKILQKVGISGIEFAQIIEAVAVHSYKIYDGTNKVAQILQDADKMAGFGPWTIIAAVKFWGGEEYINSKEIIKNGKDKNKLKEMADFTLEKIEKGPILDGAIYGLDYILKWWDMFHTKHARDFAQEGYEYLLEAKEFLVKKFNL